MKIIIMFLISLILLLNSSITLANNLIDMVLIEKSIRSHKLIKNGKVIKEYPINLGFDPIGHKFVEGDGRTPEGLYYLSYKVINSDFYISFKISYPNKWDQRNAKALNQSPGGYIMIHGEPQKKTYMKDWTNGCIALSNKHMQDFDKIVSIKTPVLILK